MIDIMTYRMRIGLFDALNLKGQSLKSSRSARTQGTINICYIMFVLGMLLLLGCDIHQNPGPNDTNNTRNNTSR